MDSLESWLDFRRGERVDYSSCKCAECGADCSGDVTILIDGREMPVCDDIEKDCGTNL